MPSRNGSVYSDNISSTSSQWRTTYKKLPKKQPASIRFMSWVTGAPDGATVLKKRIRDTPDDQSVHSSWSSGSYFSDADTQLAWVYPSDVRRYYSGSSSSSGRSSRSSRSGGKKSSPRQKHFNGAVPPTPMMQPPPPGGPPFDQPMDGHYPPPPHGDMGGHFGGGGFHPPPPMTPMNAPPGPPPPGGQPAFFDLTGQQPGGHFNRGGPPQGFHHGAPDMYDDYDSETDSMAS